MRGEGKLGRDRKQGTFEELNEIRLAEAQDAKLVVKKDGGRHVNSNGLLRSV